jgi:hypothetical protein
VTDAAAGAAFQHRRPRLARREAGVRDSLPAAEMSIS